MHGVLPLRSHASPTQSPHPRVCSRLAHLTSSAACFPSFSVLIEPDDAFLVLRGLCLHRHYQRECMAARTFPLG
ncbi:hypothetical protein C8Q76DRAFT_735465 [Earliella scabrosa]|nr:hypothetical protein C8Q76DRAFT_735465 [Earliella scabrosa]